MGAFAVGDVVLIAFPNEEFSGYKKRPAIVAGISGSSNLILCQITAVADNGRKKYDAKKQTVHLYQSDFRIGGLGRDCYVRLDRLFTADQTIVVDKVGTLLASTTAAFKQRLRMLFG